MTNRPTPQPPPAARLRLLHIALGPAPRCIRSDRFRAALASFGDLDVITNARDWPSERIAERVRACDVYLAGWGSALLPVSLASDRGSLRYICGITGEMRHYVPEALVAAGIPLTNWGDAPANSIAEGAMALLIATVKSLPRHVLGVRAGDWGIEMKYRGSLDGLRVGIYGVGAIGRRFVELLRPFGSVMSAYDAYAAELPDGVRRAASLEELFSASDAIVIHAALTPETRRSVTRELLARLPDQGVVINTARGGIIDQDALVAEVLSGRLRAGLDVLEPDSLPVDHPLRRCPDALLTAHQVGSGAGHLRPSTLAPFEEYALDNLRRFAAGEPLRFVMDLERYRRST